MSFASRHDSGAAADPAPQLQLQGQGLGQPRQAGSTNGKLVLGRANAPRSRVASFGPGAFTPAVSAQPSITSIAVAGSLCADSRARAAPVAEMGLQLEAVGTCVSTCAEGAVPASPSRRPLTTGGMLALTPVRKPRPSEVWGGGTPQQSARAATAPNGGNRSGPPSVHSSAERDGAAQPCAVRPGEPATQAAGPQAQGLHTPSSRTGRASDGLGADGAGPGPGSAATAAAAATAGGAGRKATATARSKQANKASTKQASRVHGAPPPFRAVPGGAPVDEGGHDAFGAAAIVAEPVTPSRMRRISSSSNGPSAAARSAPASRRTSASAVLAGAGVAAAAGGGEAAGVAGQRRRSGEAAWCDGDEAATPGPRRSISDANAAADGAGAAANMQVPLPALPGAAATAAAAEAAAAAMQGRMLDPQRGKALSLIPEEGPSAAQTCSSFDPVAAAADAAADAASCGARAIGAADAASAVSEGARRAGPKRPRRYAPESFQLGRRLGAGSFATVYLARHVDTNQRVVVKRLDRKPAGGPQDAELENEIEIMHRAGCHANLVEFKGWYRDGQSMTCLVMGYCEGGTLAQLLKGPAGGEAGAGHHAQAAPAAYTSFGSPLPAAGHAQAPGADETGGSLHVASYFPEPVVMSWFVQLVLALHHLHGRAILHRDLKPENIFLSANKRVIKLGDLGIAKHLESTLELAITCLGTPYYMSPEVIASRPYTYASDIWSLGCVLYEMATRRHAFEALGLPQLMFKILRNAYDPLPPHFSRPFQQLLNTMLRADQDDRPTTKDLLSLPIVRRHLAALLGGPKEAAELLAALMAGEEATSAIRRLGRGGNAERGTPRGKSRQSVKANNLRPQSSARKLPAPEAGGGEGPGSPGAGGEGGGGYAAPPSPSRGNSRAAARPARDLASAAGAFGAVAASVQLPVGLLPKAKSIQQWDSGARYIARQQAQAEMRHKARELEQRIAREQVRQQRKERDPVARAREAELLLLHQELIKRRERKRAKAAERHILGVAGLLGDDEEAEADDDDMAAVAFHARPRLSRTAVSPTGVLHAGLRSPPGSGGDPDGVQLLDDDDDAHAVAAGAEGDAEGPARGSGGGVDDDEACIVEDEELDVEALEAMRQELLEQLAAEEAEEEREAAAARQLGQAESYGNRGWDDVMRELENAAAGPDGAPDNDEGAPAHSSLTLVASGAGGLSGANLAAGVPTAANSGSTAAPPRLLRPSTPPGPEPLALPEAVAAQGPDADAAAKAGMAVGVACADGGITLSSTETVGAREEADLAVPTPSETRASPHSARRHRFNDASGSVEGPPAADDAAGAATVPATPLGVQAGSQDDAAATSQPGSSSRTSSRTSRMEQPGVSQVALIPPAAGSNGVEDEEDGSYGDGDFADDDELNGTDEEEEEDEDESEEEDEDEETSEEESEEDVDDEESEEEECGEPSSTSSDDEEEDQESSPYEPPPSDARRRATGASSLRASRQSTDMQSSELQELQVQLQRVWGATDDPEERRKVLSMIWNITTQQDGAALTALAPLQQQQQGGAEGAGGGRSLSSGRPPLAVAVPQDSDVPAALAAGGRSAAGPAGATISGAHGASGGGDDGLLTPPAPSETPRQLRPHGSRSSGTGADRTHSMVATMQEQQDAASGGRALSRSVSARSADPEAADPTTVNATTGTTAWPQPRSPPQSQSQPQQPATATATAAAGLPPQPQPPVTSPAKSVLRPRSVPNPPSQEETPFSPSRPHATAAAAGGAAPPGAVRSPKIPRTLSDSQCSSPMRAGGGAGTHALGPLHGRPDRENPQQQHAAGAASPTRGSLGPLQVSRTATSPTRTSSSRPDSALGPLRDSSAATVARGQSLRGAVAPGGDADEEYSQAELAQPSPSAALSNSPGPVLAHPRNGQCERVPVPPPVSVDSPKQQRPRRVSLRESGSGDVGSAQQLERPGAESAPPPVSEAAPAAAAGLIEQDLPPINPYTLPQHLRASSRNALLSGIQADAEAGCTEELDRPLSRANSGVGRPLSPPRVPRLSHAAGQALQPYSPAAVVGMPPRAPFGLALDSPLSGSPRVSMRRRSEPADQQLLYLARLTAATPAGDEDPGTPYGAVNAAANWPFTGGLDGHGRGDASPLAGPESPHYRAPSAGGAACLRSPMGSRLQRTTSHRAAVLVNAMDGMMEDGGAGLPGSPRRTPSCHQLLGPAHGSPGPTQGPLPLSHPVLPVLNISGRRSLATGGSGTPQSLTHTPLRETASPNQFAAAYHAPYNSNQQTDSPVVGGSSVKPSGEDEQHSHAVLPRLAPAPGTYGKLPSPGHTPIPGELIHLGNAGEPRRQLLSPSSSAAAAAHGAGDKEGRSAAPDLKKNLADDIRKWKIERSSKHQQRGGRPVG